VIWNTEIIEWKKWDAPWENGKSSKEEVRGKYEDYYNQINTFSPERIRTKFEICINDLDKTHIGWVISYQTYIIIRILCFGYRYSRFETSKKRLWETSITDLYRIFKVAWYSSSIYTNMER